MTRLLRGYVEGEVRGAEPCAFLNRCAGLGLRFCHPSRFLITADDRDQAVEACRRALRAAGKPVSE